MSRKGYIPSEPVLARIESLTHEGRGVTHVNGKAVFVDGALPGEEVEFVYTAAHRNYDEARLHKLVTRSPQRVEPKCPHFGVCGGCSFQHLAPEQQIHAKQEVLLDNLRHIGHVAPEALLEPITGPHWGYRHRARLGVKHVAKKGKVLVGFHEKQGRFLADLTCCEVLHPNVGHMIEPLSALVRDLKAYQHIPQIEAAVSDSATALVFRHLVELCEEDKEKLRAFGKTHEFQIYVQPKGPNSITLLWPDSAELVYRPYDDLEIVFQPSQFTQVNAEINRKMIQRALELLNVQPQDRVLDLFCGLGNFTLPIARHAAQAVGVEGDRDLIDSAWMNAKRNGLANAEFYVSDLAEDIRGQPWFGKPFDKILLDPPRTGALETVKHFPALGAERIVYVSCNPATLARDAELLVKSGYRLSAAGVMDMFPHTSHVESIALFER